MDNIVPISELRGFVNQVLEEIRYGVNEQRMKGLMVEMPDTVNFQCEVVFDFQALEVRRTSETTGDDTRTQDDTTVDTGTTTSTRNGSQRVASGHNQTSVTEAEYTTDA